MPETVWIIALGAIVAGFVQGLSGFAFSLVAMPFWAWTVEPELAVVLLVFGAFTGQLVGAFSVRRGFAVPVLLPFLVGGLAGIPIGVAVLPLLDARLFKTMLGLLLVVWCPIMLFSRSLPPVRFGGRLADGAAGLIGGVMAGLGGFAGPVPTLWCTLRQMDKDTQRTVVQNFNLATLGVTMAIYLATGVVKVEMVPMFAVVAAAMLLPTLLGSRIYIGISEASFRRIVLGLLTASGAAMLAATLPQFFS